ncbi:hypothetical protein HPDFL43_05895 [Hoeflea phototrophica DFL-43]|jgi:hypothetical protein|uniref:SGNH hydrolase-type esterase domain-containing protein n=1 Tax=Hoeflea phototrophica (strain DSM 17068 / NCIMB 14078 / DFL-43) TaxID=411684 RepID=A9D4U3_HOEPD|nr:hypothetical protein [Hoeflea phototrophica]EDQ33962.1 hypothetical protein HPDFL43_05895 [Hoeflea phototrophica DFL-43]
MKIIFPSDSNLDQYVSSQQKFSSIVGSARGYPFVSASGISGNQSSHFLARVEADVIAQNPQTCVAGFGTNNAAWAHENDISNATMTSSYISDMDAATDLLLTAGIFPVLFTPPPARIPEMCFRLPHLVDALATLCDSKSIGFVNIYDAIAGVAIESSKASFLALYLADPDKHHLAAAGHAFIGDMDWSAIPAPNMPTLGAVLDETHNGSFGNVNGGTFRVVIPTAAMSQPGTVTMERATFQGHPDEPITFSKVFSGAQSSGANASSLVPMRINGQTAFTVPQGGKITSDPYPSSGGPRIFTGHCNGGSGADRLSAKTSVPGVATFYKPGDEAACLSVSGFTGYSGYLSLVTEIQTDGF